VGECRAGAQQNDQQHRRGVVHARLGLQGGDQPSRQPQAPQRREDRGRIRRGQHRAVEQGEPPVQAEDQVDGDTDHHDAHHHADRGQRRGQTQHRAQRAPPGGQAALRDDHDERAEAEGPGQVGVVEPDAEAGLPDDHADRQVDQEAGHAQAGGQPDRPDRHQQHRGADQQRTVQPAAHVMPAPSPRLSAGPRRPPAGRPGGTSRTG
jgi:hypothetical protein